MHHDLQIDVEDTRELLAKVIKVVVGRVVFRFPNGVLCLVMNK